MSARKNADKNPRDGVGEPIIGPSKALKLVWIKTVSGSIVAQVIVDYCVLFRCRVEKIGLAKDRISWSAADESGVKRTWKEAQLEAEGKAFELLRAAFVQMGGKVQS